MTIKSKYLASKFKAAFYFSEKSFQKVMDIYQTKAHSFHLSNICFIFNINKVKNLISNKNRHGYKSSLIPHLHYFNQEFFSNFFHSILFPLDAQQIKFWFHSLCLFSLSWWDGMLMKFMSKINFLLFFLGYSHSI